MKKLIFGITFLIFVSMSINAQTNRLTKIYFTADEYSNNTPYIFGENVKIRLDPLFKPAYVLIKSNQNKKYFLVDSIWGYSINKHVFRLYKRRKYSLINNNGIFLYEFNNPGRHFRLEYY